MQDNHTNYEHKKINYHLHLLRLSYFNLGEKIITKRNAKKKDLQLLHQTLLLGEK